MEEDNQNPEQAQFPRPLVLNEEQRHLSNKIREAVRQTFDQSNFEQVPLAHGFIDCMALAIDAASQHDPNMLGHAFTLAFNYYVRLIKAEVNEQDELPPFQ